MSKGNRDPTPNEIKFVQEQLLGGKEPRYIKWVIKKKRDKVQDRLIVVGDYRIFSIKKTLTGKKQIQRVGHLFDLVELFSPDIDKVVIKFKDFEIDVTANTAGIELIFIIRKAFSEISSGFAEYAMPKVILLPQERIPTELPEPDVGPAGGLLTTYVAFCDYHKSPPSQEFIKFVKDIAILGSRELNLDSCPGIDRKEDPLDLVPIKSALRHNTYFTTFSMKNVPRKEITLCIADTIMHNVTIEKLCLSGVEANEAGIIAIGNSLKRNTHNRIVDLDLSKNTNMKEKGIAGLADGLQGMTHSLTRLCLAFCSLGPKSLSSLLNSLCFGKDVGWGLCELDLSFNKLEQLGSTQLSNWFNQQGKNLKYLLLSNTKVDAALVMRSIKNNGEVKFLQELDLSGNKLDAIAGSAVAAAIDALPSLNVLNVARCTLTAPSAVSIVTAINSNPNIQSASINLSENELGVIGATSISQILVKSANISSLIMRSCEFKKEGLTKIAEALKENNSLRVLDLSLNFHEGTAVKMAKLMNIFADGITRHPSLIHFSVEGDYNKYSIGKEMEPILKCISTNPVLEELVITGNKIGDNLASTLCDSLRGNNHLKYISWDKNNINSGGWQALLNIMAQNTCIKEVPYPKYDSEKAIKESKNKEQFKERVKTVLDGISDALRKNSAGEIFESAINKAKGRTYSVAIPYTDPNELVPPGSPVQPHIYGYDPISPTGSIGVAYGSQIQGQQTGYNAPGGYGNPNPSYPAVGTYNTRPPNLMTPPPQLGQAPPAQSQQQQFDYFFAPPPPPPPPGNSNSNQPGFALPGLAKPGNSSPGTMRFDEPGNRSTTSMGEVFDNFNFDSRGGNFQNDYQQEYDDSQYNDPPDEEVPGYDESLSNGFESAPPPPPPPPF